MAVRHSPPTGVQTVARNRVDMVHNLDACADPVRQLLPMTIVLHVGDLRLQDHAQGDVQGATGHARIGDAYYPELPRHKLVVGLQTTNAYILSLFRVRSL